MWWLMCDHGKGRENVQMADKSPRSEQGLMTGGEGQRVTVNLTLTISLKANDADLIIIDNGNIKEQVKDLQTASIRCSNLSVHEPKRFTKVHKARGIVCVTAILGSEWM